MRDFTPNDPSDAPTSDEPSEPTPVSNADRLSPDEIDALGDEIAVAAARITSASYELLDMIRRFDRAKGWARHGAKDCADWLSWRIGVGRVAAKQKVQVAHRLEEFPLVAEAFRKGELSYTKVRAVTREGMPPEKDEVLLHQARGATGAQLERISATYRRHAPDSSLTHHERRYVHKNHHRDGTVTIAIRMLPDEADRLYQAISETRIVLSKSAESPRSREGDAPVSDHCPGRENDSAESVSGDEIAVRKIDSAESISLVDAAVHLAEQQLALLSKPADTESGTRRPAAAERRQLLVHLRESRMADDDGWTAELHDGTPLCGQTLKRLACDCGLVVAKTDDDGDPLDVGRRRRTVSPQLLRALFVRDRHCQFPGCAQHCRAFLDAHHIQHWLDGGPTTKSNTVLLCQRHHVAVHEGGFSAERDSDGTVRFRNPRGHIIDPHPQPPVLEQSGGTTLRNRWPEIDPHTNLVRFNGHGIDFDAAVSALMPLAYKLNQLLDGDDSS